VFLLQIVLICQKDDAILQQYSAITKITSESWKHQ